MAIKIAGTEVINDNKELVLAKLAEINTTIADTAVDVFVYDTSKDSDGGAWRKRTQGTSWYNETLNTATRGSRKEFPSVAVIVAEQEQITIYDGDDPDLPMWMVFNASQTGDLISGGSGTIGSLAALNGIVCVGQPTSGSSSAGGIKIIDFVQDRSTQRSNKSTGGGVGYFRGYIADREDDVAYGSEIGTAGRIVSINVNDVAMTVLPNAPIDAATGLPVPTIGLATDGGTSVIRDDGTVVDITVNLSAYSFANNVAFLEDNSLATSIGTDGGTNEDSYYVFRKIPTSDNVITVDQATGTVQDADEFYSIQISSHVNLQLLGDNSISRAITATTHNAFGSSEGLSVIDRNEAAPANGMVAYTASDYATGYQVGDIKLATLSDTDDADVTGSDLVTNGTFDSGISGWTDASTGTGSLSWNSSGYLQLNSTDSNNRAVAKQSFATEVGKVYTFTFEQVAGTEIALRLGTTDTGSQYYNHPDDAVGVYAATFTATATTLYITIYGPQSASNTQVDNISVRLAEEDRSVNGNGLQVFGSITKNPVASGADLVAYSGFSGSNHLEQPYNSDLDFGTGDFCYTWWANITSVPAYLTHFTREYYNGSAFVGPSIEVFTESAGGKLRIYLSDDGYSTYDVWNSSTATFGVGWQHFAIVRTGNTVSTYINGTLDNSFTLTRALASLNNANAKLYISRQANGGSPMTNGSLALFRASATAPSPDQIKKIYEDEKHLFQENAQATLYGSSDAVTALAYDDSTELLHVGTSAGRSDFQGLRRVNNTTNAVGAAISASNGMIVEE